MSENRTQLLRDYAAGRIAWAKLRHRGWNYGDVLDGLGNLGLRPPIIGDGGPNAAAIAKGREWLRATLADHALR